MSEHAAFLKAIRAAPDDDLPRLIYADWLDERGDPRGEFVRLQCDGAPDADGERLAALEAEFGAAWCGPLVERFSRWRFRRGFVEPFLDALTYLAIADELERTTEFASVHVQPTLPVHAETLAVLASAPAAEWVRSLFLGFDWIGDRGVATLCASPHLGRLTYLDLRTNGLTDVAATALAHTPNLPALRNLYLVNNLIADAGTQALANSRHLNALTTLHMGHNLIDGRSHAGRALRRRFGWALHWR